MCFSQANGHNFTCAAVLGAKYAIRIGRGTKAVLFTSREVGDHHVLTMAVPIHNPIDALNTFVTVYDRYRLELWHSTGEHGIFNPGPVRFVNENADLIAYGYFSLDGWEIHGWNKSVMPLEISAGGLSAKVSEDGSSVMTFELNDETEASSEILYRAYEKYLRGEK